MPRVTAQQLYDYAKSHGLCREVSQNWTIKHFQLISDALAPDERVLTAFCGLHNYKSASQHDSTFAYAVTNKRFILAQKKLIGSVFQTISLQNVNDITMNKKLLVHTLTIDTIKETFNIAVNDPQMLQNIYNEVHRALEIVKNGAGQPAQQSTGSMTAQLVELKKLLDAGIITQKGFDAKKSQILGI